MKEKLLRVRGWKYTAGCVWVIDGGRWRMDPRRCAPILRWMTGLPPSRVAEMLRAKGATWEWLP